jgi:hypothetical protein
MSSPRVVLVFQGFITLRAGLRGDILALFLGIKPIS